MGVTPTSNMDQIKHRIREAWERGATSYDEQYGHGLRSTDEHDAWSLLLRRLLPPEPPLQVLDVGTGTGFLAILLAELGHTVTGIDISESMLRVAHEKATRLGITVDFRESDAHALPFPDASFDAVVSRHLLWTLLEPERAVREWARVTRPGGRVLAIDGIWQGESLIDHVIALLSHLVGQITRAQRDHRYPEEARRRLPLWRVRSPQPACNVFARAGLHHIRSEELTWIDAVERRAMPLWERLQHRYRRYLVEAER
jgi:ubiquinone/menaquinone biosynthesis C-methylase UbiE